MPDTEVVFYREEDGTVPVLNWLDGVPPKARDKCIVRIERLQEAGYELRRPEADMLRDGIHELRASWQGIQYRILYFFDGQTAVLAHGLTKEREVPGKDIDLALRRRAKFQENRKKHTYGE